MRASARTLPTFEVAVRRGRATLAGLEHVWIHTQAHRAARVAPLEAGVTEDPVKARAEEEGLDRVFTAAGFEWRDAGCSMCLGMNADILQPGERCASTSNRNFEGRQGAGGRTHLLSPPMAAAAALAGHLVDVRELTAREVLS